MSQSPFAHPEQLPLRTIEAIAPDTTTSALIVAPHPDDETLGCGGAIALLRRLGCAVRVLVVSDGTRSHPRSRKYPAPALQALRQSETLSAMSLLQVNASDITFLGLPDGAIPMQDAPLASQAIDRCCTYLTQWTPTLICLPWRYDPHPDHRATWQLMYRALTVLPQRLQVLEYPIWDWDPSQREGLPQPNQSAWRLDIHTVVDLKTEAIAAYRSQTTNLIDDDPTAFQLAPEMLTNFTRPWELYLEEQQ